MAAFQSLFSLRCVHEYFAGQVCTTLDLGPTAACERLLRNADLVLHRTGGCLTVYFDPDRADALPDDGHFDFLARPTDANFFNYTDALSSEPGKSFFFCNTAADLPADGRLSRQEWVSKADLQADETIPPELLQRPVPTAFPIRISIAGDRPESRAYYLPWRTRRTTWLYYVTGPGIDGSQLCITGAGQEEAFDYRGDVDLINGRRASLFRSRMPLPLLHEQPAGYSLRERRNGRVVVRKLPFPSPRALARENFDGEEVLTSQMFVNL